MVVEVLSAAAMLVGGTIGLALWVDHRSELEGRAAAILCCLIAGSGAFVAAALRLTVLAFPLGLVPAVLLGLAAWTLVVLVTTRPRPAIAAPPKADPPSSSGPEEDDS